MKIKISATYEGKCMICKKDAMVFSAGDEESKKVVCICQKCANKLSDMPTSEVIEKYGKPDKDAFSSDGIKMMGLDKLDEKIKEIKEKED